MPQFRLPADPTAQQFRHDPSLFPAGKCRKPSLMRHRRNSLIAFGVAIALVVTSMSSCAQSTATSHISHVELVTRFASFVAEASRRYGIPAAWIRAVIQAESVGDVHATSPVGAMGLMQIMPDTWTELRRRYHLGDDPYDPHDNIMAGAAYLQELRDRYGSPGLLAAYNAGPARWEDHLATGRPLPAETRAYLTRLAPIVGATTTVDAALSPSIAHSSIAASLIAGDASRVSADTTTARSTTTSRQAKRTLSARLDGARADIERAVRRPVNREVIAMKCVGHLRALGHSFVELHGSEGRRRQPTNGRQGKRPAVGSAYVVGRMEEFAHHAASPCWRLRQFPQRIQRSKRHRSAEYANFRP